MTHNGRNVYVCVWERPDTSMRGLGTVGYLWDPRTQAVHVAPEIRLFSGAPCGPRAAGCLHGLLRGLRAAGCPLAPHVALCVAPGLGSCLLLGWLPHVCLVIYIFALQLQIICCSGHTVAVCHSLAIS